MKTGGIEGALDQINQIDQALDQSLDGVECPAAVKEQLRQALATATAQRTTVLREVFTTSKRRHDAVLEQMNTLEGRLLQNEKMAAIGQLAAGVAHEINNPIGYIGSNLNALHEYMDSLLDLIAQQQTLLEQSDLGRNQSHVLTALVEHPNSTIFGVISPY